MIGLTFGKSLPKVGRIIAIVDLVYIFIYVVFSTAIDVIQAAKYLKNSHALHVAHTKLYPSTITGKDAFAVSTTHVFEFVVALTTFAVFRILLELWMCRLLTGACDNLDKDRCRRWLFFRLVISIAAVLVCIAKTVTIGYGWFDWFFEWDVFYRCYELLVVYKLKLEIDATNSRVRVAHTPNNV